MDNSVDWRSPAFRQNMAEKMQVKLCKNDLLMNDIKS